MPGSVRYRTVLKEPLEAGRMRSQHKCSWTQITIGFHHTGRTLSVYMVWKTGKSFLREVVCEGEPHNLGMTEV